MTKLNLDYYFEPDWFNDQGQQVKWSASFLTALQKCKRYYFYTVLQRWKPKDKGIDLTFGSLFSAAVEMYYHLYLAGKTPEDCLAEVVQAVLIESRKYEGFMFESVKTRRALVTAIVEYFDKYSELDRKEVKAVEQIFHIPVADGITFVGKFDVVKEVDEGFQLLDQKTTRSALSRAWVELWTPNNQMSMYLYAGAFIFPAPVRHILLDAISISKTGIEFMRGVVKRTKNELDQWAEGVFLEVGETRTRDPEREEEWPQNPTACGYYRGCEFRKVCSSDPKMRLAYLNQSFEQESSNEAKK